MRFVTVLSGLRKSTWTALLTAGGLFVSMSGVAVANDLPLRCVTKPSKICAKWAPGAPGTIAGRCIQWKWVHAQCIRSGRQY